jgi:cytochrome c oxidase cbb3-type subunit 4
MTIENFLFDARSLITVASFLSFIAIFLWAYSGRRAAEFEAAARLPLDDEMELAAAEKKNG